MQNEQAIHSKGLMNLPRTIAIILALVCILLLIVPILSGNSEFKKRVDEVLSN